MVKQEPKNLTITSPVVTSINSETNTVSEISIQPNNTTNSIQNAKAAMDLEKIINRLESVTSRLEGFATSGSGKQTLLLLFFVRFNLLNSYHF